MQLNKLIMGIILPVIAERWMSWTGSCVPLEECYQWLVVELMHIYPFFLQLLLILTLLTELPRPSMHREIHSHMNHSTEGELYCKNISVHSWIDWVKMDWFFLLSKLNLQLQECSILCCRPLRHCAAILWVARDLHCWPFWFILKKVIFLPHGPKTQVVRHIPLNDTHLQATKDKSASEVITFIPHSSFTVGQEKPLHLVCSTHWFLVTKNIL